MKLKSDGTKSTNLPLTVAMMRSFNKNWSAQGLSLLAVIVTFVSGTYNLIHESGNPVWTYILYPLTLANIWVFIGRVAKEYK